MQPALSLYQQPHSDRRDSYRLPLRSGADRRRRLESVWLLHGPVCLHSVRLLPIFANHDSQHRFVVVHTTYYNEQIGRNLTFQLEGNIFHYVGRHRNDAFTTFTPFISLAFSTSLAFSAAPFSFMNSSTCFFNPAFSSIYLRMATFRSGALLNNAFKSFSVFLDRIHQFLYFGTRDSFDTAHTGSNRAFADNTDHTDLACSRNVGDLHRIQ